VPDHHQWLEALMGRKTDFVPSTTGWCSKRAQLWILIRMFEESKHRSQLTIANLARTLNMTENEVIEELKNLQKDGLTNV
jgi:hypothetical protein